MTDTPEQTTDEQDQFVKEVHEHSSSEGEPLPRMGEPADETAGESIEQERQAVTDAFDADGQRQG